jgi:hypothetical protein
MRLIKILYIRPFSKIPYGAEEQDLEAGLKILKSEDRFEVFDIKIDLRKQSIFMESTGLNENYRLSLKEKIKFCINKLFVLDHAMTQAYTYQNYSLIAKIIKELEIDIVFTNTASTVLFGDYKNIQHIYRSVSFEPIYVLKVIDSKSRALLHSILKLMSIRKELSADALLSISPRDARYYAIVKKFFGLAKIEVVPLRQLCNFNSVGLSTKLKPALSFGFLGSTYNVLHNRKSLNFILDEIPSDFWLKNDIQLNIYGRKIPTMNQIGKNIVIHNWIENIDEIYENNVGFLVPFFLASGMQSKVFEPLIRGRILICDPRVLSDYPFDPLKHYIPAVTGKDFMDSILWLKENKPLQDKISKNAAKQGHKVMGSKIMKRSIIHLIYNLNSSRSSTKIYRK